MQLAGPVGGEYDDRPDDRFDGAEFGDGHCRLGEHFEQQCLELIIGTVDLVDEQHRRPRAGMTQRPQDGPFLQEVGGEQGLLTEVLVPPLGQPDREQLPRVVPLVEGLVRSEALVALQPDERRVEHRGKSLGRSRLADTGLALQQQRQPQLGSHVQRGGEALVDEVAGRVEPRSGVVRIREEHGSVS